MDIAEEIGVLLIEKGWTLAVAESCTGGLLGGRITSVPGSSAYFVGGIVAYSNNMKMDLLGIPSTLILEHGAVSEEVAKAMADGVAGASGADIGVAVTGVAGPDGSENKPPGTVYLCVITPTVSEGRLLDLSGDREDVRESAVVEALRFLADTLERVDR
ncbi:nicotinamide-nucleotide amidohydrolase family protein [bacterium]|nr:MAG: nicotinamide-nucleotide amidohydrolase family protein [bacterium]